METYGVIELTKDQMLVIEGGKPLSYYIGYGLGFISGTFTAFFAGFGAGINQTEKK